MATSEVPVSADRSSVDRLEAALDGGDEPPVGRYRIDLATGRWAWSDEVYRMHGFQPGDVVPSTPLMVSHKHPENAGQVDGMLRRAAATGDPFSSVHRIIDAQGKTRTLVVTGQGRRDPVTGTVTELVGYLVDVTKPQRTAAAREATASIRASAERSAVIEQAKGILMLVHGVEAPDAFALLRQSSNRSNIALRDIAGALVRAFTGPGATIGPTREAMDAFLVDPRAYT